MCSLCVYVADPSIALLHRTRALVLFPIYQQLTKLFGHTHRVLQNPKSLFKSTAKNNVLTRDGERLLPRRRVTATPHTVRACWKHSVPRTAVSSTRRNHERYSAASDRRKKNLVPFRRKKKTKRSIFSKTFRRKNNASSRAPCARSPAPKVGLDFLVGVLPLLQGKKRGVPGLQQHIRSIERLGDELPFASLPGRPPAAHRGTPREWGKARSYCERKVPQQPLKCLILNAAGCWLCPLPV